MHRIATFTIFILISISCFTQKDAKYQINKENLIGTWVPMDSVYIEMKPKYACLEFTELTFMSYQCINAIDSNTKCPYQIVNNHIRIICDEHEQNVYKIKYLTLNEISIDIYIVKQNGKLKLVYRNMKYRRDK